MGKGVRECWEVTKCFAEGKDDVLFLLLYGGYGNGKTHLCSAAGLLLNQSGIRAQVWDVLSLLSMLRAAIDHNTIEDEIQALKDVPVLILDDFKVDGQSAWANTRLEEVINYRYGLRLPTMLTTNGKLEDLPGAIESRFSDTEFGRRVFNGGSDYRRMK